MNVFVLEGRLNGRFCRFKLNTGSNVSLVSARLVGRSQCQKLSEVPKLKYTTGEKVPVGSRWEAQIAPRGISLTLPLYVADMLEDCILRVDFFDRVGMDRA